MIWSHLKWLYITPIGYSPITVTRMVLSRLVILFAPLVCFIVQMNVPSSSEFTGLISRLPSDTWLNRMWSKEFPPFLLQDICGLGTPSAPQLNKPDVSAIKVCLSSVFSVNFAVERSEKNPRYHSSTIKKSVVCWSYPSLSCIVSLCLYLCKLKRCVFLPLT